MCKILAAQNRKCCLIIVVESPCYGVDGTLCLCVIVFIVFIRDAPLLYLKDTKDFFNLNQGKTVVIVFGPNQTSDPPLSCVQFKITG